MCRLTQAGGGEERASKTRVVCERTCSQSALVDLSEGRLDVHQRNRIKSLSVEWA